MKNTAVKIVGCLVIALAFGFSYAFTGTDLQAQFAAGFDWLLTFSQTVFRPQTVYYAESFLHPLLANLAGATGSLAAFKAFCLALGIAGMAITCGYAGMRLRSVPAAWLFCVVLLWTFAYYRMTFSILGYPDPLTMLFLSLAALAESPIFLGINIIGASMSHFSLTVVASVGLLALLAADGDDSAAVRRRKGMALVGGLVVGKLLVELWFLAFHYRPEYSRLDFVRQHGLGYFFDHWRSYDDLYSFLLTPGEPMLYCVGGVILLSLWRRRYATCLAVLLAMTCSYIALFLTVDGIRIFAVSFVASYVYALSRAVTYCVRETTAVSRMISVPKRARLCPLTTDKQSQPQPSPRVSI